MSILIADDYPFTLQGTKAFVEGLGYTVIDICSNGITALNLISKHSPSISLLDINMPGMDGLELLEKINKENLRTKVILITMHNEMSIYKRANELGVYGYILKNYAQEELEICLQEVTKGRQYISPLITQELVMDKSANHNEASAKLTFTERKILEMIGKQHTSKQIADLLFISEKTVEGHRRNIIEKLDLPKEKNVLLHWVSKNFSSQSNFNL
jgi:DNA-binding NarL/FixJ family response regulator